MLNLLLRLSFSSERLVPQIVRRGPGKPHGVHFEDVVDDAPEDWQVAREVLARVVNLDLAVGKRAKAEVGNHVPGLHPHEDVLESFPLVKPGSLAILILIIGEDHRHEHRPGEAGGVDRPLVVELRKTRMRNI